MSKVSIGLALFLTASPQVLMASRSVSPEVVELKNDVRGFARALDHSDLGTVNAYLKAGIDPNGALETNTPSLDYYVDRYLHKGSWQEGDQIVAALLNHGANVNYTDPRYRQSPLTLAAMRLSGVKTNPERFTALCSIIKILINNGADVNHVPSNKTPILRTLVSIKPQPAQIPQLIELLDLFYSQGGNINPPGIPILESALVFGLEEVGLWLLDKGVDHTISDEFGLTPVHSAASKGHSRAVEILIQRGADINAKNERGDTTLMLAVISYFIQNKSETIRSLLEKGADPTLKDNRGKTALDYADSDDVKNLLRGAMEAAMEARLTPQERALREEGKRQLSRYQESLESLVRYQIFEAEELGLGSLEEAAALREDLTCPITREPMKNPVRIPGNKQVYEFDSIKAWVDKYSTDPFTRQRVTISDYTPATELMERVEAYMKN